MNRLIVLLFKIILGKIKYWPHFNPNLTPQAQSSEFNIIRKLKNVPWRDNCAWGVNINLTLISFLVYFHLNLRFTPSLVSPDVLFHPNSSFSFIPNTLKSHECHPHSNLALTSISPFMLNYTLQIVSFQSICELVSNSSLTPRSRSTWIKVKAIMDGRIGQNVIHGVGRGPNSDFFTLKMVGTKWLDR